MPPSFQSGRCWDHVGSFLQPDTYYCWEKIPVGYEEKFDPNDEVL